MIIRVTGGNDHDLLRRDLKNLHYLLLDYNIKVDIATFMAILTRAQVHSGLHLAQTENTFSLQREKNEIYFSLRACEKDDPNSIELTLNSKYRKTRHANFEKCVKYLSDRLHTDQRTQ